jgi:anti-sigma B factor antagonist
MELECCEIGNVTVVRCKSRIVYGDEANSLRDVVKGLLKRNPWILLNLAKVPYVDSGGLGALFGLHTSARNAGGLLMLACANPRVCDLLHRTHLATVLNIYDSEEAAIRSFVVSRPA